MITYNHTILSQIRNNIANKIGDMDMIFTPASEIDLMINEALYTFGALSEFWKDNISIKTEARKQIYDIFTDSVDKSRIAPSLTYKYLIDLLNPILFESLVGTGDTSEFLKLNNLLEIIRNRYNQYQLLTNLFISKKTNIPLPALNNRIDLGKYIIDIIRIVYVDEDGTKSHLSLANEEELQNFDSFSLVEQDIPRYYTHLLNAPNIINMYPIPIHTGNLEIIGIYGEEEINISEDTLINLPNNLVPYLKFGVLEDIFTKSGVFHDPNRAKYNSQRWNEGVTIGRHSASLMKASADGRPISIDSLEMLDLYNEYQLDRYAPTMVGMAGYNKFGINTIPTDDIHSLDFTSVVNANIPIDSDSPIDIETSYIPIIEDYVVHLSQQKCGAYELNATLDKGQEFIKTALNHNIRLQNRGIDYNTLIGKTQKEEDFANRLAEDE